MKKNRKDFNMLSEKMGSKLAEAFTNALTFIIFIELLVTVIGIASVIVGIILLSKNKRLLGIILITCGSVMLLYILATIINIYL